MLDKLTDFVRRLKTSADFNYDHDEGGPADEAALARLEEAFQNVGHTTPPALADFYRRADGFRLRWTYKHLTHPDYITSGDTDLANISSLISALRYASSEPIPFDNASDVNQVTLRVEKKRLTLHYRDEYEGKSFPLTVGVEEYFRLLDESRGLYPWRELFIKSKSFRVEPELEEKFFSDLKLLFQDADAELFRRK